MTTDATKGPARPNAIALADVHFPDHHVDQDDPADQDLSAGAPDASEYWAVENVELRTVGIDIGSSTSHLMFSRVHLQRLAQALSSRFVVVGREVLWRSPVMLTPYLPDNSIDAERLGDFVAQAYAEAGLDRASVDSGAVILTGEALKRRNARAIAELFAADAGRFICASAGHHLEAVMAAHGSGAAALSRREGLTVLNVDVGGGTSKLVLVRDGEVLATAALEVGGRLLARDGRRVVRIEQAARRAAHAADVSLVLGEELSVADEGRVVAVLVDVLVDVVNGGIGGPLGRDLLVTEPFVLAFPPDVLTFSGGVAEYLYGRETAEFDDLAPGLAAGLRDAIRSGRLATPLREPEQGIRATVIGASQFSVQVSGITVGVDERALPLQNVPVLAPSIELSGEIEATDVAAAVQAAARRFGVGATQDPVAVAFRWGGDPHYRRVRALAEGVVAGLGAQLAAGGPLVVLVDGDVASSLAHVLREELQVEAPLVCLDGLVLQELDYVDVGQLIRPSYVVPVVIKSLLFTPEQDQDSSSQILLTSRRSG